MIAHTLRLDADVDPVAIGCRTGLLWAGEGIALAGSGEALRLAVRRPGGAAEATEALAELVGPDEVKMPGTGPVAFTALAFDPAASGELIVPELVAGRGADGRRWVTVVSEGSPDRAEVLDRLRRAADGPPAAENQPTRFEVAVTTPPEQWRDAVAEARDRIRNGALVKAVLARELRVTTDAPIDPAAVLTRLRRTFPTANLFAVDGFLGASPELLVGRIGDVVRAHPLAGTAPRASDPVADAGAAARLLGSDKDRWEHRITIDWLLDTLLPFCSYVDAEPEPSIVTLANVHHLGTRVEGRLSSPAASVLELVAALHPTPAVGGDPQERALALITQLEPAGRGRYAGPVGWVDAAGNGQLAVGIRSAELQGNEVRLFAGVGVVADSDPDAELAETRAKFSALLGALLQP